MMKSRRDKVGAGDVRNTLEPGVLGTDLTQNT